MKGKIKNLTLLVLSGLTAFSLISCKDDKGKGDTPPVVDPGNPNENEKPVEATAASGAQSYIAADYEERAKILGTLEEYAVKNQITGITLFEDSGYQLIRPEVKMPVKSYIPGFGFGIVSDGEITKDLISEQNQAWKRYYHTYQADNPNTINYMNDKGSVVGDLVSYVSGTYWTTQLNETKDGTIWTNALSNSKRPEPLNAENGLATRYKFEVKVGKDLKYTTLSKNPKFSKYNNREVEVEDYVTAYKLLFTQAYGMARGGEQLTGTASIKGVSKYYNDSKTGYNEESWKNNVQIKGYEDNGKAYLEIEFNLPTSQFFAMYYLNSQLYAPVPEEFLKDLGNGNVADGMKVYGNLSEGGMTPVDTFLSTGPYAIEQWDAQQIVFKKNPNYNNVEKGKYKIEGVHFYIDTAIKNDSNAAFDKFINSDKYHVVGIPSTRIEEYKNDPRSKQTIGSTTTKLNVNTTTQEEWNKLFGPNGTVTQTPVEATWKVEPAMSNTDFVDALSFAIDRQTLADNLGRRPSVDYYGPGYYWDPEESLPYNYTEYHEKAVEHLTQGTDGYGYSLEKAATLFKRASDKLIADGLYEPGDKIILDVVWQDTANVKVYGEPVYAFWQKAFEQSGSSLKLEFNDIVPQQWSDAYYAHMLVGQFDLGFGGISGNPLNPLNFMECLKSDNSSGFTLNWGPDTNEVSKDLVYDNMYWSFDALWTAAEKGGYFENGLAVVPYKASLGNNSVVHNADGSATITVDVELKEGIENLNVSIDRAAIFSYFGDPKNPVYDEDVFSFEELSLSKDKKKLTFTLSKELVKKYTGDQVLKEYLGVDIYFKIDVLGAITEEYVSLELSIPELS